MLRYFFLLLLIIPKISKSQTSPKFCVDHVSERQTLDLHLLHYTENITDSLPYTLPIFKENKWTIVGNKGLTFSPGSHHDWFKIYLYATRNCTKTIFINYPTIPEVDIWFCQENDSILDHISLGLRKPFNVSHPSITSGFTYDINFEKGKIYTCYIHFKAYGQPHLSKISLSAPSYLKDEYLTFNSYFLILRTIFFMIIMVSLIGYLSTNINFFLNYAMILISLAIFIESEIGFLWKVADHDPTELYIAIKIWTNCGVIFNLFFFFRNILNEPKEHYFLKANKWLFPLIRIMFISAVLISITRYHSIFIITASNVYTIAMTYLLSIYNILLCIVRWKQGNQLAKYLLLPHSITLFSALTIITTTFLGWIPRVNHNFLYLYLTVILEAFVLFIIIIRRAMIILDERKTLIINHHIAQQEISEALIQGQEIERNRIGRELHDHVGGSLAFINKRKEIKHPDTKKLIQKSLKSVRNLSHGLVSPSFEYEDFQETITDLGAKYNTAERKVHIHFMEWETTENVKALLYCYRIVQELLQNAEKHSKASRIFIQFFGGNESRIIYEDNGVGANDELLQKGIGLQNISNRVKALNGEMTIDTSDKGVFIVIDQLENIFHH